MNLNLNLFIRTTFSSFFFVVVNVNEAKSEMLPQSDDRILTQKDILGFDRIQLRIARNEIFARKGYIFKSDDLKRHFSQFNWYSPKTKNVSLSKVEKINVDFIKKHETSAALLTSLQLKENSNHGSQAQVRNDVTHSSNGRLGIENPEKKQEEINETVRKLIAERLEQSRQLARKIESANTNEKAELEQLSKLRERSDKLITFLNLNFSMSKDEMIDSLTKAGYQCASDGFCGNENSGISISKDRISFNCKSYNGCGHSQKDMAKAIANKYSIDMQFTFYKNPKFNNPSSPAFLGSGSEGDRIYVVKHEVFPHFVVLEKGSIGNELKF